MYSEVTGSLKLYTIKLVGPINTPLGSIDPWISGGSISNLKIGGIVSSSGDMVVVKESNTSLGSKNDISTPEELMKIMRDTIKAH